MKYSKYTGVPELTNDDKTKIVESSNKYMDYIDSTVNEHHFSDMQLRYPYIFNTYFKNIPKDVRNDFVSPTDENSINVSYSLYTK
jgi:hypothetical protein